jgi:hypothetical protein
MKKDGGTAPPFMTSPLDGASRPSRFNASERAPGTYNPTRNRILACRYTEWGIPAPLSIFLRYAMALY